MPFIAEIVEEGLIKEKLNAQSRLIVPLSIINKKECTGERLKAIVSLIENYNSTLLIADTLQRFNLENNEDKATKMGENFIERNAEMLRKAIHIHNNEDWEKYREIRCLKLIRWSAWGKIKAKQLEEAKKVIEESSQKDSELYNAMLKVAVEKLNLSKKNNNYLNIELTLEISNSIFYQQEENAYMLTYEEFDYHLYPGINHSQKKIYQLFERMYKLPKPITPRFIDAQATIQIARQHSEKILPSSMRIVIKTSTELLSEIVYSSEYSPELKSEFVKKYLQQVENILEQMQIFETIIPEKDFQNFLHLNFFKQTSKKEIVITANHITPEAKKESTFS